MQHPLWRIAEARHIDEAALIAFAMENAGTFSVTGEGRDASVGTWHSDAFVKAFFENGGTRLTDDEWKRRYGYA